MSTTTKLPAITRPNGKPYQPRQIVAAVWDNEDWECGVVVLGTHDINRAQPLAEEGCGYFHGTQYAIKPAKVWWRDGFQYGRRAWVYDEVNGRAGVCFTASDDPEEVSE